MRTSLSLSARSTSAPAGSEKSRIGMEVATATRPTRKALLVSSSASHPSAIVCIHGPMSDIVCPIRKIRKFRCRKKTRNGLSDAGAEPERGTGPELEAGPDGAMYATAEGTLKGTVCRMWGGQGAGRAAADVRMSDDAPCLDVPYCF